nr:MAG TPA: hypothetical protein [Caudoviricetes sp.]
MNNHHIALYLTYLGKSITGRINSCGFKRIPQSVCPWGIEYCIVRGKKGAEYCTLIYGFRVGNVLKYVISH